MSKNCRLADKTDTRCCECTECLYLEDKKNRPWVYEKSLNQGFFNRDPVVEAKVEDNPQKTLDNLF